MLSVKVTRSLDINQTDSVKINGKEQTFSLADQNKTDGELILIYMYCLPKFPTHGIKVGMTKCRLNETFWHAVKTRIAAQQHELALPESQYEKYGLEREVIYWGVCLDANNDSFKDYHVHEEILKAQSGLVEKEQEWFTNVPADELIQLFNELRHKGEQRKIYTPRKEQQDCIDNIMDYFDKNPHGRFLLNCKMRFGKSFTTYKYCEEADLNKILILTFVPAVESSWKEDLNHIKKHYRYFTDQNLKQKNFIPAFIKEPYVIFVSLQNYLGKDKTSFDVKEKIAKLQDVDWDMVILDEYHFGAWNQRTQGTIASKEMSEDLDKDYQNELKKSKDVIKKFKIKTQRTICLSGTPFKALAKGEFNNRSSFTYSYFDEQRNKYPESDNSNFRVVDPDYASFPDMKIFGYNMSKLFAGLTDSIFSDDRLLSKPYFSLNKFFATRKDENGSEEAVFIYESEIKKWLNIIKGKSVFGNKFPYSNPEMIDCNTHTLWLMPTVNSCKAMEKLLLEDDYFVRYQIINLSNEGVGAGVDAYDYLTEQMIAGENTGKLGSIAITVNKLTIGVTVKKWSAVFVLKDLASPEQYFQAIFRIQTPYVVDGKIKKNVGYVYDFNIDRASALLLKYAEQSEDNKTTKLQIAKLIVKYIPIFINGDTENPISEQVFYELAEYGDSSGKPLSQKITDTSKTTRMLDEETMAQMLNDKDVSEIIKHVFAHAKFKASPKRTIPSKPEDGFDSEIAKKGRNKGYELGQEDYGKYVDYDDKKVQALFEETIESYLKDFCPKEYDEKHAIWFKNGFKKGYQSGVNAPIKREQCGAEDGHKFVQEIKKQFGEKIQYKNDTKSMIDNFANKYLNDINNIPEKYRGMLYKRWYCDSFKRAYKNDLTLIIEDSSTNSIEDADNVLKHILARLFEFLYISVYRETTFNEIFKNADPDIFLQAVGITKKDFEILNKYKVFQENVLNNYIHEFFVNESLGATLNLNDEQIKEKYRNSFDWFGFGLEKDVDDIQSRNRNDNHIDSVDGNPVNIEEIVLPTSDIAKDNSLNRASGDMLNSHSCETNIKEMILDLKEISLSERIAELLGKNKPLKASKIANLLGVTKKAVNQVLHSENNMFIKDIFFNWRLK